MITLELLVDLSVEFFNSQLIYLIGDIYTKDEKCQDKIIKKFTYIFSDLNIYQQDFLIVFLKN